MNGASKSSQLSYSEGATLPSNAPQWAKAASERIRARRASGGVGNRAIPPLGVRRVLLHSCCAPCSGAMVEEMVASDKLDEVVVFFYNPNIHPRKEYEIRKVGEEEDLVILIDTVSGRWNLRFTVSSFSTFAFAWICTQEENKKVRAER